MAIECPLADSAAVAPCKVRYRIVAIAPDHAAQLLERRRPGARRHAGAVRAYGLAMREHRWILNGMSIVVSRQDVLLDGVQRLLACVEAQVAFETFLVEGVDSGLCHSISQQSCRSFVGVPDVQAEEAVLDGTARSGVTCEIETIDPVRAAEYLLRGVGNRHIGRTLVASIARDLKQGRWMFDAQPICFAQGGRLLNGELRLRAAILADRAIEVAVVRGLSESAYATYDNRAKRRTEAGDQLESFGDRALVHAMANLLWQHECKTQSTRNAKATAAEILQIVAQHPRLLVLRSFARKMGDFGRASVVGYAAYAMERDDPALAAIFLAALETGADQRPGHPILTLRGALQKLRGTKASQATQLALLLDGWERFKTRSR